MRAVFTQMNSSVAHGAMLISLLCSIIVSSALYTRLKEVETILQKKSHGRLIHVSDFINEESGRLVIPNSDGSISEENDARKIIYPGTGGDPWWDTKQLLEQIRTKAIPIFERAHPGCQALFIFDQSSAHASLGPDALNAFDMNCSNGGKQQKQGPMTTIPNDESVPQASAHGQQQSLICNQQWRAKRSGGHALRMGL
jgi:hypothetical protein